MKNEYRLYHMEIIRSSCYFIEGLFFTKPVPVIALSQNTILHGDILG